MRSGQTIQTGRKYTYDFYDWSDSLGWLRFVVDSACLFFLLIISIYITIVIVDCCLMGDRMKKALQPTWSTIAKLSWYQNPQSTPGVVLDVKWVGKMGWKMDWKENLSEILPAGSPSLGCGGRYLPRGLGTQLIADSYRNSSVGDNQDARLKLQGGAPKVANLVDD